MDNWRTGYIDLDIDLGSSFRCGQIYHYWETPRGFITSVNGDPVEVWEAGDDAVGYRSLDTDEEVIHRFLGGGHDLEEIIDAIRIDDLTREAVEFSYGLRLLRCDFYPTTVSFISSAQSTNRRTRKNIRGLCEHLGEEYSDAHGYHGFPDPERIAELDESVLRDLGFGYRSGYLIRASEAITHMGMNREFFMDMSYDEAHKELKRLSGVGDKVADCIQLFSLGYLDIVALDTWMNRVINDYYPGVKRDGYMDTAMEFRSLFNGYTGYAQTYLYNYMRNR